MSTHQAPGAVNGPTGPTLNETTGPSPVATPLWARVTTAQGRSHAESRSRTADRAAHTPADDTTQVSAVLDPPAQGSSIMTRDNVPNPTPPVHIGATPADRWRTGPAGGPRARRASGGHRHRCARRDSPRCCPGRCPGHRADVPGPSHGGVPRRPARLGVGQNGVELGQGAVAGVAEAGRLLYPGPAVLSDPPSRHCADVVSRAGTGPSGSGTRHKVGAMMWSWVPGGAGGVGGG